MPYHSFVVLRNDPEGFEYRTGTHKDAKLALVAIYASFAVFMLVGAIFAPPGEKLAVLALILPAIAIYGMIMWPMHNYHVIVDVKTRFVTVEGKKKLQMYFDDIIAVERHQHQVALSVRGMTKEIEICMDVGREDLLRCAWEIDRLRSITPDHQQQTSRTVATEVKA